MSVATPAAFLRFRSTRAISSAEPRSMSANAHACPTAPAPTTPTLLGIAALLADTGVDLVDARATADRERVAGAGDDRQRHLRAPAEAAERLVVTANADPDLAIADPH